MLNLFALSDLGYDFGEAIKRRRRLRTAYRGRPLNNSHEVYRNGGSSREAALQVVYSDAICPSPDCGQPMQAIDFRLEDHGRAVPDPLLRAWWDDTGFVGRCPACRGWVHFTIRGKRALSDEEATGYPRLPDDWYARATIL